MKREDLHRSRMMKPEIRRELLLLNKRGRTRKEKPPELLLTLLSKTVCSNLIKMPLMSCKEKKTWILLEEMKRLRLNELEAFLVKSISLYIIYVSFLNFYLKI
jgi:predicted nucleic acid-binding Zn ribbon protein